MSIVWLSWGLGVLRHRKRRRETSASCAGLLAVGFAAARTLVSSSTEHAMW
jgi:hypothetical protein